MRAINFILILGLSLLTGCKPPAEERALFVFAAASTAEAVTELAQLFEEQGGGVVQVHCAASSTLARQIERGAGADVFLSANPLWVDYLVDRGCVLPKSRYPLLSNRLVLIQPHTAHESWGGDAYQALSSFRGKLAMADPDHVPAGRYARQVLQQLGLYAALVERILPGGSARATLTYVERGEASLGIVYATDALISSKVQVVAMFAEGGHEQICYQLARTTRRHAQAESFVQFLQNESARAVFRRFGFLPLEDATLCLARN